MRFPLAISLRLRNRLGPGQFRYAGADLMSDEDRGCSGGNVDRRAQAVRLIEQGWINLVRRGYQPIGR
jgi:hypothetical protein